MLFSQSVHSLKYYYIGESVHSRGLRQKQVPAATQPHKTRQNNKFPPWNKEDFNGAEWLQLKNKKGRLKFISLQIACVKNILGEIHVILHHTFGKRQKAAMELKMPSQWPSPEVFLWVNKRVIKWLDVYIWLSCRCFRSHPIQEKKVHIWSSLLDFAQIINAVIIHLEQKHTYSVKTEFDKYFHIIRCHQN